MDPPTTAGVDSDAQVSTVVGGKVKDKEKTQEKKEMKRLAAELALGKELNHKSIEYEILRKLFLDHHIHHQGPTSSSSSIQGSHEISFIAIDFETWEQGTNRSDMTLEVGWSVMTTLKSASHQDAIRTGFNQHTFHYVNQDLLHLRNGRYVADHRDDFIFGPGPQENHSDSEIRKSLGDSLGARFNDRGTRSAKTTEIGLALNGAIDYLKSKGTVFIVFHDSQGDLKDLARLSVSTKGWKTNYPDSNSPKPEDLELKTGQVYVLDTQRYMSALMGTKTGGRLGKMAESCLVEGGMKMSEMKLHNAANDAHITLAILLMVATGPPLKDFRPIFQSRLAKIEQEQKGWSKKRKKGFATSTSEKGKANQSELNGAVGREELLNPPSTSNAAFGRMRNRHQSASSASRTSNANVGNVGLNLVNETLPNGNPASASSNHKKW